MPSMRTDLGLLSLRVFGGLFMLLFHGWPKLQAFSWSQPAFGDPIGIGVLPSLILVIFAEFFCALFVFLGIATRWASIPIGITMVVAALIVHAPDPMQRKELAFAYLFVYIALACLGGGRLGLDNFVKRARN
jgi:putative oxidoreductase